MTIEQSDAYMLRAITQAVEDCRAEQITTTELVAKLDEILDCGRALDAQRKGKEDGKL